MAFDFDLFVIGGGSGGVRAARTAAATGAKVALAEESRMGGTCVIRGCVPKKLMVYASKLAHACDDAEAYGWSHKKGAFDWPAFRSKLHDELDRLERAYRDMLDKSGVKIYDSRAVLDDPHTIKFANGRTVSAKHILVATGGHPVRPHLPCADLGLVSNDLFLLEDLPKSILIIGGGYIACEFACILNGMGVEVTQYYRGAQILRGFDDEARGLIADLMRGQGIDLHVGSNIVEMAAADNRPRPHGTASDAAGSPETNPKGATDRDAGKPIWVKATNGSEKVFDDLLFATGRKPNTMGLGLEEIGVKLGRDKQVIVDGYSQSSVPSIYAIGDVTQRVELTPVAIREAMAFTETVFRGNPTKPDHELVPSAIFTQPELGTIGMTEEAAAEQEEIETYCASFRPMQHAFAGRKDRVLMKLVVSKEKRTVLGCHIVAEEAGELIQMVGIAVKMGATKEDFDRTCAVHPTISEEIVTMATPIRGG